jgi:hypothetical protein
MTVASRARRAVLGGAVSSRVGGRAVSGEPTADPFQEHRRCALRASAHLLGGQFHFETDSRELLRLVKQAFGKLPAHKLPGSGPDFFVKLVLTRAAGQHPATEPEPPPLRTAAGSAILCGALESASFVAVTVKDREALIVVSQDMLQFPYHVRYELLEFAVYTLAGRAQRLVPLHGACVGAAGRGLLLLGLSGAGKSTLSLHCLLQGFDFVAEDSVLVRPGGLLATGLANFLHIRADSLHLLPQAGAAAGAIRRSPLIRRRSGVQKLEIDLRQRHFRLAPAPLPIAAVVIVSAASAGGGPLLRPLRGPVLLEQLAASQRYAAGQPGWAAFTRQVARLPSFELRRGSEPLESVSALRELLGQPRAAGGQGRS